jgi:hypothetical protein
VIALTVSYEDTFGLATFSPLGDQLRHCAPWTQSLLHRSSALLPSAWQVRASPSTTPGVRLRTANEGRSEQRAADGYLKVLSLAEQEARWLDATAFNLGPDPREVAQIDIRVEVPEPPVGFQNIARAADQR